LEANTNTVAGTIVVFPVLCDCCGKEKLAEIRGTKLIIFDTRHGQRHFVSIEIEKLRVLTTK
jgi:hypothetical protein